MPDTDPPPVDPSNPDDSLALNSADGAKDLESAASDLDPNSPGSKRKMKGHLDNFFSTNRKNRKEA